LGITSSGQFPQRPVEIYLDETAAGSFCEFEGEKNEIMKFARSLGFSRADLIKLDYVQLLKKKEKIMI
jgi:hypothetical protein